MNKLIQGDCLIENNQIQDGSVDLILTDLPYGIMDTDGGQKLGINDWDKTIDPKDLFDISNRILRKNGKIVLFSQEPYTTTLINKSIPNIPFNYRAIWVKDNFANCLSVNKAMVSYYEDVLVFSKTHNLNEENEIRDYLIEERDKTKKLGYTDRQLRTMCGVSLKGGGLLCHYWGHEQWAMPTENHYNTLKLTGCFDREFSEIKEKNDRLKLKSLSVFNLWEGNKYKSNILKYKKDYNGYHPTQKPVLLLEDLIKTFSNENDLVVDFTMGSGSTGVACMNTNRNFIGIEKDEKYYNITVKRIKDYKSQQQLF